MKHKPSAIAFSLIWLMAAAGCASGSGVRPPQPLPEPPAEAMVPAKADFLQRMESFLFDSPPSATPSRDD